MNHRVRRVALGVAAAGALMVTVTACGSSGSSSGGGQSSSTSAATSSSASSGGGSGLSASQLAAIPTIVRLPCSKTESLKGKTIGLSWEKQAGYISLIDQNLSKFLKLSHCGATLKIDNANGDPANQITQAQGLVAQQVNLLFENPASAGGWQAVIQQAKTANIPVINWSSIAVTGATMNVSDSQAAEGESVAAAAAKWLQQTDNTHAQIGTMVSTTDIGFKERAIAFKAALLKLVPTVQFIGSTSGGYESPDQAESNALSYIQANPNMKMIFTDWDADTLGTVQAAKEAGKTNPQQFAVIGQDGSPEQLNDMKSSSSVLQATGAPLWGYEAGVLANNMLRLLMHQSLPPTRILVPLGIAKPSVKGAGEMTLTDYLGFVNKPFSNKNAAIFAKATQYFSKPMTSTSSLPTGTPIKATESGLPQGGGSTP